MLCRTISHSNYPMILLEEEEEEKRKVKERIWEETNKNFQEERGREKKEVIP